jgi:hypothetical protein
MEWAARRLAIARGFACGFSVDRLQPPWMPQRSKAEMSLPSWPMCVLKPCEWMKRQKLYRVLLYRTLGGEDYIQSGKRRNS